MNPRNVIVFDSQECSCVVFPEMVMGSNPKYGCEFDSQWNRELIKFISNKSLLETICLPNVIVE